MLRKVPDIEFNGTDRTSDAIQNQSGVYLVGYDSSLNEYIILYVGESGEVKSRILSHEKGIKK